MDRSALAARTGGSPVRTTGAKPKVLIVRQPVKRVGAESGDRVPVRLALATLCTLGGLALIWGIGHLGYRLGFAPLMRVPDLAHEPTSGLATGIRILLSVPRVVLEAGIAQPPWLMLGFALIAIPGAGLGAAKPRLPGGPKPPTVVDVVAILGAVAAGLNAAALVAWISAPYRQNLLRVLPDEPGKVVAWADNLSFVAGLDVLAVVAGVLWSILVFRLPVPRWLKAMVAAMALFALAVTTVGMSISNAAAAQVHTKRAVFIADREGLPPALLLGSTRHRQVQLRVDGNFNLVELSDPPEHLTVIDTRSVVEFVAAQAPAGN